MVLKKWMMWLVLERLISESRNDSGSYLYQIYSISDHRSSQALKTMGAASLCIPLGGTIQALVSPLT